MKCCCGTCRCETVNTVIFKNFKTVNYLLLQVINCVFLHTERNSFGIFQFSRSYMQKKGRTNVLTPGVHKSQATSCTGGMKFCRCFLILKGLKHGTCTLVAPIILKWLQEVWKICVLLARMMLCFCITLRCNTKCVCNIGLWQ